MADIDLLDGLEDNDTYALTWHAPEGHLLYWSLRKGWVADPDKAWVLTLEEVDMIEDDERLFRNLPQNREVKDGANWEPVYGRVISYAPGVNDNEEDNEHDDDDDQQQIGD